MVKELKEEDIKTAPPKKTQREQIRNDLKYAEEHGITSFELEDQCYNYKTLASTVREVCTCLVDRRWRKLTGQYVKEHQAMRKSGWVYFPEREREKYGEYFSIYIKVDESQDYIDEDDFYYLCGYDSRHDYKNMFKIVALIDDSAPHQRVYVKADWSALERMFETGKREFAKPNVKERLREKYSAESQRWLDESKNSLRKKGLSYEEMYKRAEELGLIENRKEVW